MTLGVRSLAEAYRAGECSPHEIVDEVHRQIGIRGDDAVWISRFDAAMLHRRADELVELRAARGGDLTGLPLYGIPFAVKDNIDVAGLPTTAACPAFAYHPTRHAGSVARLLAAGAIAVGKTNLDQFATGLNGTRSPYGACESVFGGDLISGGSSSGSAVAVAAGQVPFSLGTDTAGSGRVPAAMNGIVGLKPTRGLVGASGVLPACRSLDCVSVFSLDVDDAATVLDVLAGPDPDDPWSRPAPPALSGSRAPSAAADPSATSDRSAARTRSAASDRSATSDPSAARTRSAVSEATASRATPPAGHRLALAGPGELDFHGDSATAAVFAAATARAAAGADAVVHIPLAPLLEAGDLLYDGPWVAERLAGLADFLATNPHDVLPVIRTVIERGVGITAVEAFRARHRLQELRAWCTRLWERADALLLPTTPTTFTRAQIADDPVARNLVLGRYTQFANLLDLAAVALPAGMTPDGRPVGMTLLGPAFSEPRLLTIARDLHAASTRPKVHHSDEQTAPI